MRVLIQNEVPIKNAILTIRKLKCKYYQKSKTMLADNYNGHLGDKFEHWESGIIAQDVMKIPELSHCVVDGNYIDDDGNNVDHHYSIRYNDVHCWTIAATQELDAKNTILETKVQQLQSNVQQHEIATMSMKIALNKLLAAAN